MKQFSLIFATTAMLLFLTGSSWAMRCACCAEPGTYDRSTGRPSPAQIDLISKLKFEEKVQIYLTAVGFDGIRGIEAVAREYDRTGSSDMSIVDAFTNNSWRLTFKTAGGETGTLTLPRPATFTNSRIDTFQRTESEENLVLYKEMAFKGNISIGTGLFRRDVLRPTAYTLIFQGRGNMCDDVSDYSNWRLELNGQRAKYAFSGKLK